MSLSTTNTICIYFENCEEKITPLEYANFIVNELEYSNENVIAMGVTVKNRLRLKLSNEELVEDVFRKIRQLETYSINDRKYTVNIENESTKHTVKIHGVPYEMADDEIKRVFASYGIVENIKKEKWKGIGLDIYNEIISVKMEIKNPIPSYIRLYGRLYWVTYFGQTRTCRRCNETTHEAKDCKYSATAIIKNRVNFAEAIKGTLNDFTPLFVNNDIESTEKVKTRPEEVGNGKEEIKAGNKKRTEDWFKVDSSSKGSAKGKRTDNIRNENYMVAQYQDEKKGNNKGRGAIDLCSLHSDVHLNQAENKKCRLKRTKSKEGSSDEVMKPSPKKLTNTGNWADDGDEEFVSTSSPEVRTSEFDFSPISQYTPSKSEEELNTK